MTTYKEINGTNIEVVSSDPTNPVLGQIWYNSTTYALKALGYIASSSWATGGALNSGRYGAGGAGTSNSLALVFGGFPNGPTGATELYNGSSWTEVSDLNHGRGYIDSAGTTTAALAFGGNSASTASDTRTEKYNGSSWTEVNNLTTGRYNGGGAGTQTSALFIGGYQPPSVISRTESYNGTSWTEVADLNTTRSGNGAAGVNNTSALTFGGTSATAVTESWNGSSWTEVADLNTGRNNLGGAGIQTLAVGFGGQTPPYTTNTETWISLE